MRCRCLSAWSRTTQHVARQPCLRLNSHLCKVLIVLAILIALQYLFTAIFEARQIEPLFAVNFTHSRSHSHWSLISHSRDFLFPFHNSSFNGSMRVSVEKILSPVKNVSGETKNSSLLPTHDNAVGNVSSLVLNISLSSVVNQTTAPSLIVPVTGKSLCPPIPPNLSKYYA